MFEIRRGCEKIDSLLKRDFEKVWDPVYKFECWRKVLSEQDKNHKGGTNKVYYEEVI